MKFEIEWPIYVCQGCKKEVLASGVCFRLNENRDAVVRETFGQPDGWYIHRVYLPISSEESSWRDVALCVDCLGAPHVRF